VKRKIVMTAGQYITKFNQFYNKTQFSMVFPMPESFFLDDQKSVKENGLSLYEQRKLTFLNCAKSSRLYFKTKEPLHRLKMLTCRQGVFRNI